MGEPPDVPADGARQVASLESLLAEADFISLHVDLNPGSHHLIGVEQLSLVKPTAILVNTSRGPVIDQPALLAALKEGRVAGVGLDVLATEPPDPDDPPLRLPNLFILPHIGSNTRETRRAIIELAIENLVACLEGRACEFIVNRRAK